MSKGRFAWLCIVVLVACWRAYDAQQPTLATPTAAQGARPPATEPRSQPIARATVTPKYTPTPTRDAELVRFANAVWQLEQDRDALNADAKEWQTKIQDRAPTDSEIDEYENFVDRRLDLANAMAGTNPPEIARQAWSDWYEAYGQWADAANFYYESLAAIDDASASDFYQKYSNALREGNRYYVKGSDELSDLLENSNVPCSQVHWCATPTK